MNEVRSNYFHVTFLRMLIHVCRIDTVSLDLVVEVYAIERRTIARCVIIRQTYNEIEEVYLS